MTPLLIFAGLLAVAAGQTCVTPFVPVGGQCLYFEDSSGQGQGFGWQDARDYCKALGGSELNADLASFPTCDQYTEFARFMAMNAPTESSVWMGAHTLFSDNMWEWVTLESLQTGVPFWYYGEDFSAGNECAAADGTKYYRLVTDDCSAAKSIACSYTPSGQFIPYRQSFDDPVPKDCPDHSIQVGNFCYVFNDHDEEFTKAEEKCRDDHHSHGGELYYPSSCEEFTHMAHHLEATEDIKDYFVGAVDVSGQGEWTWVNGEGLSGGPPYWASGEPSHTHETFPREHCTTMCPDKRFYLEDGHCADRHHYICKLTAY